MTGGDTYEVAIIRYGTRTTTRSRIFYQYERYGEPDAPVDMDYFVWVIRNQKRTVVVDTGFNRASGDRRERTMLSDPVDAMSQFGVDLGSVSTVVLSHGHYDHIGNLNRFPAAQFVVAAQEVDFWQGPLGRKPHFSHSVEQADLAELARAGRQGRVLAFNDEINVAEGIEVIRVGGHTPGQSVVRVRTKCGPVLLASDAVHYQEELDRDMLFVSVVDLGAMYLALDRIRGMMRSGDVVHVVTGHDPGTFSMLRGIGEVSGETMVIGQIGG